MEKGRRIKFKIENQIVQASQGSSTLEALLEANFPIDHSCGGHGTCGTCRVIVRKKLGELGPRNELESELATDRYFTEEERLCCQTQPVEGLEIYRPGRAPIKNGLE